MNKVGKVFKYIFLGLAILTTSFIVYESCLDNKTSAKQTEWLTNIFTNFLNNGLNLKEKVDVVEPTSISLGYGSYAYNTIDGYDLSEIPLGCTKQLSATILPANTTNKSITFSANPAENVNLVQKGSALYIEGLKEGPVSIQAKSVEKDTLISTVNMEVVDLKAPANFTLASSSVTVLEGLSSYIDLSIVEEHLRSEPLLTCRYYDKSKLTYSFSNEGLATVYSSYIKGISAGDTVLTVSNGNVSKTINIHVNPNPNPLIAPTNMDITGSDTCYVLDADYDRSDPGKHNTPLSIDWKGNVPSDTNVTWEVSDPLVALVDDDGKVRGYRQTSSEDVSFTVTATSVANPSLKATKVMSSKQVIPTYLGVTTSYAQADDGFYEVSNGKSISFNVAYGPINVSKTGIVVTSTDSNVANPVINGNSFTVYAKNEGEATITVSAKYNETLTKEIKIRSMVNPIINNGNKKSFTTFVRKYFGGHASLFALDTFLIAMFVFLTLLDHKKNWVKLVTPLGAMIFSFFLALLSEFLQKFAPGRSASWSDVVIDMNGTYVGIVFSFIVILIIFLIVAKNKKKIRLESPKNSIKKD